jgi:hypothetical protein
MVVTMENAVFWDIMPCGSCKNRRFRGMYCFHHQSDKNWWAGNNFSSSMVFLYGVLLLVVTVNVILTSQILVTLMMEVITFLWNIRSYKSHMM